MADEPLRLLVCNIIFCALDALLATRAFAVTLRRLIGNGAGMLEWDDRAYLRRTERLVGPARCAAIAAGLLIIGCGTTAAIVPACLLIFWTVAPILVGGAKS